MREWFDKLSVARVKRSQWVIISLIIALDPYASNYCARRVYILGAYFRRPVNATRVPTLQLLNKPTRRGLGSLQSSFLELKKKDPSLSTYCYIWCSCHAFPSPPGGAHDKCRSMPLQGQLVCVCVKLGSILAIISAQICCIFHCNVWINIGSSHTHTIPLRFCFLFSRGYYRTKPPSSFLLCVGVTIGQILHPLPPLLPVPTSPTCICSLYYAQVCLMTESKPWQTTLLLQLNQGVIVGQVGSVNTWRFFKKNKQTIKHSN